MDMTEGQERAYTALWGAVLILANQRVDTRMVFLALRTFANVAARGIEERYGPGLVAELEATAWERAKDIPLAKVLR